ncbi:MAG: DUF364 domain-containing protein [Anaerolineales bacterium]|jgi:uncharacterized protein (DUF4213/DUF364 family)|nr:DUF364 domain-containing protein [Anaerolineales bacterium]
MRLTTELIATLLPGKILTVQVGLWRTAVIAETDQGLRCGLASTLSNPDWDHRANPLVRNAGQLHAMTATDLAGLVESPSFTETSIGLATINALLPRQPEKWADLNAGQYLAEHGAGKNVAVVGHFPFVERLRDVAKNLWVFELLPRPGDIPARFAPDLIPQADLVAITATTLINKTFQGLIELCQPGARVILIGPSTPLSPVLYAHGIDILSGTIVSDIQRTLAGVSQAISLHQLRQQKSVRLVTLHQTQ